MTAPDPRLDEIQARLDVHVKCTDCGKCRVSVTEEWCPECDYWACEGGLACADDPYPADVAFLLAELRKAHEALEGAVAGAVAGALEDVADRIIGPSEYLRDAATCRDIAGELRENAQALRAAVAAAKGDERG